MRCCYSKATALIFVWSLCVFAAVWCYNDVKWHVYSGLGVNGDVNLIVLESIVPLSTLVIAIPLSGWLADQRFGNFNVFKAGCVLMFLGSLLLNLGILVLKNADLNGEGAFITSIVVAPLACLIFFSGGSAGLVTVFQLGLDQMPDASSTDVISYIQWYCISIAVGFWSSNSLYYITQKCYRGQESFIQIWGLYPMLCTSIILCTFFVFGKKWLIIEPKSPQSLKTIYRVLKFAAKHKAPLNRSAFTYWEENIPSRIDLGKSRYGGPFTLEQVEDVKTLFRLLITFLPVWITVFSSNVYGTLYVLVYPLNISDLPQNSSCVCTVFSKFTYSPFWCFLVTVLLYKFVIYSLCKHSLGSSLKRNGVLTFLACVFNISFSVISIVRLSKPVSPWPFVAYSILSCAVISLFLIFTVEFVCAQSPYGMRGLLSGFAFFTIYLSCQLGFLISLIFTHYCNTNNCKIVQYIIGAGFSAVGFLLYVVVARKYKLRVREEGYDLYQHITDIYCRYLRSHRLAAQ